jgi:hypothetical protein
MIPIPAVGFAYFDLKIIQRPSEGRRRWRRVFPAVALCQNGINIREARGVDERTPVAANRPKKRGTLNPALPVWGRSQSILCKLIGCAERDQTIIR